VNSAIGSIARTNRLLDAIPAAHYPRLMDSLRPIFLDIKTVLFEPGQIIDFVDFPRNSVVSLVTPLKDGAGVSAPKGTH